MGMVVVTVIPVCVPVFRGTFRAVLRVMPVSLMVFMILVLLTLPVLVAYGMILASVLPVLSVCVFVLIHFDLFYPYKGHTPS